MRILSVRIRNLNSLAGDWTIRLDGPEYEADGIFAITGPTGAGKSTILDAICLALYGRTPRLDKITKNSNEIMSRQTAECLAETRFRTASGEFLCSWSQNRAGKKTSGKLQQPKHRLYDSEGRSLAEKTTEVVDQVTALTGMDFQRFTQAMLLAQGRFASFLLADGDERAPLLEQITGTAVYSDISIKTHERNRAEQARLDALDNELAALNALSPEEEQRLADEKNETLAEAETWAARERALRDDLARLKTAEALERDRKALVEERETLRRDEETFAPDKRRLELARRASGLVDLLEAATARRDELRRDKESMATLAERLPVLEKEEREATTALSEAKKTWNEAKTRVERDRSLWKRVRGMDADISARRRETDALVRELETRLAIVDRRQKTRDNTDRERRRAENDLALLLTDKARIAGDAALTDVIGAMETRLSRLEEENDALISAEARLSELERQSLDQRSALDALKNAADQLTQQRDEARERALATRRNALTLLDGENVSAKRALRDALASSASALEKARDAAKDRASLFTRIKRLANERRALDDVLRREEEELRLSQEKLSFLKEKISLQETIRSYEEERKNLRDGVPCPLCGSLLHPFAEREPEAVAPENAKSELSTLERLTERLTIELAGHRRDASHADDEKEENERALQEKTRLLRRDVAALSPTLRAALDGAAGTTPVPALEPWENGLLSAMTLTESAPDLEPLLTTLLQERSTRLAETDALLQRVEALENTERALREKTEALQHQCDAAQNEVRAAEANALEIQAETSSLCKEISEKKRQAKVDLDELNTLMRPFNAGGNDVSELRASLTSLIARRNRLAALLERETTLRDALAECQKRLAVEEEAARTARREWEGANESLKARSAELSALEKARKELFGSRSADEEEQTADRNLRQMEETANLRRDALERVSRSLAENKSASAALTERMTQRAATLRDTEASMRERLNAEGFEREEDCRNALLRKDRLDELSMIEKTLAERKVRLDDRENELQRKAQNQTTPLPSREETERALAETGTAREAALQRLGGIQERLSLNHNKKERTAQLRTQREAQAAVCRRWAALNDLIGSADGKKFRNYAQELTFRRLIIMANRQLSFMTDRYLLTPDQDEALTLNVIDRYQADAVRSSRNLSGGESFLVSLALALGLAQMAGRTARVDSVFLDEGFGTLDEESLGVALDMLASLRRKGKTIGVISHIQAVRDRVNVQIQVSPTGNGKSALSGPGVSMTNKG